MDLTRGTGLREVGGLGDAVAHDRPTITSVADSRNGTRQPQLKKASSGRPEKRASTSVARTEPVGPPATAIDAAKPRFARAHVLGRHQRRTRPLAADRETLDDAERDQNQRRGHTDRGVGRHETDRDGHETHHQQRDDENVLAAELVAEVSEQDAADGP